MTHVDLNIKVMQDALRYQEIWTWRIHRGDNTDSFDVFVCTDSFKGLVNSSAKLRILLGDTRCIIDFARNDDLVFTAFDDHLFR